MQLQALYKTGDQEHSEAVILPYEKKAEYFVEDVGEVNGKTAYCVIKRIFDILLSLIALVVLAIPMLIIALIIKLSSKGTVFYHQERLGLNGKPFNIIKFRTMRMDAEANGRPMVGGRRRSPYLPVRTLFEKGSLG